jgi:hypothetical protein
VLDTLWKKTIPSKLFHLERVSRRPDNLPLPTSTTSLTWREVIHKLIIGLLWPVCHAQTSTACHNKHKENKHKLPKNWFSSHRIFSRSRFLNRVPRTSSLSVFWANKDSSLNSTQPSHRLGLHVGDFSESDTNIRVTGSPQRFSTGVELVILLRAPYAFRQSGGNGNGTFSRLTLAILFACTRVDTCHP